MSKIKKYQILQSYTVVELHHVIADSIEAALKIMDDDGTDTYIKSYDDYYFCDNDGQIIREISEVG